jgi:sensor histidine kinase regulating citrate/malate metabolism
MKRFRKQFQGLYWRQLLVIVSMVMLTLFLLGASFFSLSYNYAKNQESGEMQERARMVAQLAAGYLNHSPDYDQENFRQLATVAATMTDVDFLISDTKGHVLLSTDETMEGKIINLPWDLTQAAIEGEGEFQRTDLNGLYDAKRFVAGLWPPAGLWWAWYSPFPPARP